jgi:DNA repair exonuclease SbcCD ATPase subunit
MYMTRLSGSREMTMPKKKKATTKKKKASREVLTFSAVVPETKTYTEERHKQISDAIAFGDRTREITEGQGKEIFNLGKKLTELSRKVSGLSSKLNELREHFKSERTEGDRRFREIESRLISLEQFYDVHDKAFRKHSNFFKTADARLDALYALVDGMQYDGTSRKKAIEVCADMIAGATRVISMVTTQNGGPNPEKDEPDA